MIQGRAEKDIVKKQKNVYGISFSAPKMKLGDRSFLK